MRHILLLMLAFFSISSSFGQKVPMKLGKVDIEDLEMQYYPSDSSVEAAILCEFGLFDPERFSFKQYRRVKIFTKEGLNSLVMKGPGNSKSNVRGYVINLVDGEIVKEKITRDHVAVEKIFEDYTRVRVAPPNVRVGSIIDIEYEYSGFPYTWQFQRNIPVRHSELIIPHSKYFTFKFQQIGYEEVESKPGCHFIAKNMPAFRPEPYINSENNYITSLLIEFSKIHYVHISSYVSTYYASFADSWDNVNKHFMEHKAYGDLLNDAVVFLNKYADTIRKEAGSKAEMIHMALETLHENVTWNDVTDLFPSVVLRKVWDEGIGTSADMNFLFIALLRKIGIESSPVVMSQRSRGTILRYFPTVNKFNYTVVAIPYEGDYLIVDASDKYSVPGMMPTRSINGGGFKIDEDGGEWIEYTPKLASTKLSSCNLNLNGNGDLLGQLSIKHRDYDAIDFRRKKDKFTDLNEYLEDFESENENYFVTDYTCDIDSSKHGDVIEFMDVEISGHASLIGNMITLQPVVYDYLESNPFKLEKRDYPVDFTTPIDQTNLINIRIPEGMIVEQLPNSMLLKNESNSLNYKYIVNQTGSMIQLMINMKITKPVFFQTEYQELKLLFDAIIQKEKENIILVKAEE